MRNRYVQAPYLSPGFSDFGIYHDAFACLGVGCESDDQKGFMGWIGYMCNGNGFLISVLSSQEMFIYYVNPTIHYII